METPAAQNVASATTGTEGHEQYRSLKQTSSGAAPRESQAADEAALQSDGETITQESGQELTDEQKSQRKQRNDEKRKERWYEERGRLRAEMAQKDRELAELKAGRKESTARPSVEGKPTLKQFLEAKNADGTGKFKTYEDAEDAYLDARDEYNREQWKQEQSSKDGEREAETLKSTFQADVKEFAKTHDDFNDVFTDVRDVLDQENGNGTPLTNAILRSKNPSALIYHIGLNEELLTEFGELSEAGDWQGALELLGVTKRELKATSQTTPGTKTTVTTPKPPKHVRGAGDIPDLGTAQRQAVEKNDFAEWRKLERQRKAKGA